jgi:RNA polymerase primary sigma factor
MRQLKITKSITNRESASFEKYLQEIGKEELITAQIEVELARKIRAGDQMALEKLVRANLRFVVSVAKQYQTQGLSLPDLINEGNLGLIKAAKKFDETRGFIRGGANGGGGGAGIFTISLVFTPTDNTFAVTGFRCAR